MKKKINPPKDITDHIPGNLNCEVSAIAGIELFIEWRAQKHGDVNGRLSGIIGIGVNILSP